MGHERVGVLPKTKRWRTIVAEMAAADAPSNDVPSIARHTLSALGHRYLDLAADRSIETAFEFLVDLARATGDDKTYADIARRSALSIVADLGRRLDSTEGSRETAEIVKRAAADAITTWAREHAGTQEELFAEGMPGSRWRGLGTGAGFCELSRLFFAHLTERYLLYFLDREASAVTPDLKTRIQFSQQLHRHLADVSRHSFETAEITRSFAAGWYNKYAVRRKPTAKEVRGFLSHAFSKLREDLQREGRP